MFVVGTKTAHFPNLNIAGSIPSHAFFDGVLLSILFTVLASCASTSVPPIGSASNALHFEEDERRIWQIANEIQRRFDKSGLLYEDPALEEYLSSLAQKLLPYKVGEEGPKPRVRVLKNPFLNAFMLPHGVIYFHSGMLARMENEAQLTAVLSHELAHFVHRHPVKEMRSVKNKLVFLGTLQILLAAGAAAYGGAQFGSIVGQLAGEIGQLWALAAISGYSKELETEADEEGLRAVVQAGYDPREALKVFELLKQERDERRIREPFFFGTHPRLQERIDNHRRLLETQFASQAMAGGRLTNTEEFLSRIHQLLLDNAVLDLQIGRLKTARAAIDRHLKRQPNSPRALFLVGEFYRRSGDNESAMAAYTEASRFDPNYAEPHRELGFLYRAQGWLEKARKAFRRYIELSPNAVDVPIVRGYLAELQN